jgi:gentisate 1,2-dioxygenase
MPDVAADRREFYQRLDAQNAAPLWEVLGRIIPPEPQPACVPALWHYKELRPLLMEAGRLITTREAERRVLILENPGLRGASRITQSIYAGLQLVMPGEVTSVHRHTTTAIRFILEGEGGYTAVNGERATMHPGDFILTPSWTSHDHGNPSGQPMVWLDGLDVPIVNLFDTSFAGPAPREDTSGHAASPRLTDMVFAYPYSSRREALERAYRTGPVDPCHGAKIQYQDLRGYPMLTMAAFLQLLPAGFRGGTFRSTDATVYCAVEGCGLSRVGGQVFEWREHDVFAVPSWRPVSHEAETESVLFSFSDRAAQIALGLWREEACVTSR